MNPHARPVEFPRKDDGLGFAWSWEGQRFTPAYEARAQHLFEAISLFPDWTPAIEFEGSEDGEVIVAYYKDTDHWRYLFPIEDPSEQSWVDELIAADKLMAYLQDYFAEATPLAEAEIKQNAADNALGKKESDD